MSELMASAVAMAGLAACPILQRCHGSQTVVAVARVACFRRSLTKQPSWLSPFPVCQYKCCINLQFIKGAILFTQVPLSLCIWVWEKALDFCQSQKKKHQILSFFEETFKMLRHDCMENQRLSDIMSFLEGKYAGIRPTKSVQFVSWYDLF